MLIAHLPSGYLVGRAIERQLSVGPVLAGALVGGMITDIDMLYFYFIDAGQTHHHAYVFHWLLFWAGLCIPAIIITHAAQTPPWRNAAIGFFLAAMLHMVLDSIGAPVYWLKPFADGRIELVEIPALDQNWIWSFVFHWTFLLELAIWAAAIALFARRAILKPRAP